MSRYKDRAQRPGRKNREKMTIAMLLLFEYSDSVTK